MMRLETLIELIILVIVMIVIVIIMIITIIVVIVIVGRGDDAVWKPSSRTSKADDTAF